MLKGYNGPCKRWDGGKPHFEAGGADGGGAVTTHRRSTWIWSPTCPYDICLKADQITMAHSPELRAPSLSQEGARWR